MASPGHTPTNAGGAHPPDSTNKNGRHAWLFWIGALAVIAILVWLVWYTRNERERNERYKSLPPAAPAASEAPAPTPEETAPQVPEAIPEPEPAPEPEEPSSNEARFEEAEIDDAPARGTGPDVHHCPYGVRFVPFSKEAMSEDEFRQLRNYLRNAWCAPLEMPEWLRATDWAYGETVPASGHFTRNGVRIAFTRIREDG